MAKVITIRNQKTEKDYQVDELGWEKIKEKGWESRFTIVRETILREKVGRTFMPAELQDAVRATVDEKEQPATGRRAAGTKPQTDAQAG